ncbi:MAG: L-threonylcarbamoyladenylate synthase [Thiothrix sp.]|uniref:L-threonylcarbamoyladenylate synthase n=1 Tax=Thiothrix sp. TaxID=1032 RepID=UPI0026095D53|nr:L-threonylcarbamoyladenylate synthase [Thiothrix sp.]MDD5391850.1 L-threonylcarbamoyladenylate synthase [Thiothrix sp.]
MAGEALAAALHAICCGGVIAYPTEAVYGLGCNPADLLAVQRILDLKQRPAHKGLILIAADFSQLEPYLLPLDSILQTRVFPTWPGPVTWLLPVNPDVSPLIRGKHDTLAVRITAHPLCRELCLQLGHPLISTSANLSDQPPARSAREVTQQFGQRLDYILDAPLGERDQPTEIRDGLMGNIVRSS